MLNRFLGAVDLTPAKVTTRANKARAHEQPTWTSRAAEQNSVHSKTALDAPDRRHANHHDGSSSDKDCRPDLEQRCLVDDVLDSRPRRGRNSGNIDDRPSGSSSDDRTRAESAWRPKSPNVPSDVFQMMWWAAVHVEVETLEMMSMDCAPQAVLTTERERSALGDRSRRGTVGLDVDLSSPSPTWTRLVVTTAKCVAEDRHRATRQFANQPATAAVW